MPHPVLSAIITFGLVNVPVRLYTAAQSKGVAFHLLDSRSGQRVRQQLVSNDLSRDGPEPSVSERAARTGQALLSIVEQEKPDENAPTSIAPEHVVPRQELVKGYEIAPGQYVEITADELKRLEVEANQHAEIQESVPLRQVDPIYFEKTYSVGPAKGSEKVYKLLARAMFQQARGAIAKLIMRGKEKLVLVRPTDRDRLLLEVLYYADEVRELDEIAAGEVALSAMEVQLAEQVIAGLSTDQWHPERYHDTYRERVLALIEQKRRGQPIQAPKTVQQPPVIDLMDALRRSLQQTAPKAEGRASARTVKKARKAG
ncbi:MAG: hypothetical protein M3Z35_11805 [Nitrospirota bacterium]|nr:hypothetical protein [Nitrospirota bacterium]